MGKKHMSKAELKRKWEEAEWRCRQEWFEEECQLEEWIEKEQKEKGEKEQEEMRKKEEEAAKPLDIGLPNLRVSI